MNPKSKRSIQEIVSRRIKMLRIRKHLTRKDLARQAGLHYTYLAKIENGKKLPLLKTICKLAAALQIETHELLIPREEAQGRLSQKATELIKIINTSSPAEISLYFTLLEALNKKKKS